MYPQELHELHNDCPSAPEKAEIKKNMLSTYCEKTAKKNNKKTLQLVKSKISLAKEIYRMWYWEKEKIHTISLKMI